MKVYEHGNYARYVLNKCRCPECSAANSRYERERTARLEPAYVVAGPARAHIEELAAAGVGLKQIAKVSGVSHGALSKLVFGIPGRAPSKRIRKSTLDRILAVTPADAAPGAKVPAGPSWSLIDEMIAAGVPKARVAEGLGQKGPGLQLSRNTMSARNVRAVAELHARWRAGQLELARRDSHGNTYVAVPPPSERGKADISDLLLELAEIVEERNAQPWRAAAACRTRPAYLWFPARGDNETASYALKICGACMVRNQCRAANIDQPVGIYAGMSARTRREIRGEAVEPPTPRPITHGTNAGYATHIRRNETPCRDCLDAHARYKMDSQARRRESAA